MFCGSATGVLLPPYVVYKGVNCYPAWCANGIPGGCYSSNKSGWFDHFTFTDWFKRVLLPHIRRQPGKKVLLGDNLSSHISVEVIELCREHDIEFVCLPCNSTDKMQPLDVGFFGPMKQAWRKLLQAYAKADPTAKLLEKKEFPRMLRELVHSMKPADILPPVRTVPVQTYQ